MSLGSRVDASPVHLNVESGAPVVSTAGRDVHGDEPDVGVGLRGLEGRVAEVVADRHDDVVVLIDRKPWMSFV